MTAPILSSVISCLTDYVCFSFIPVSAWMLLKINSWFFCFFSQRFDNSIQCVKHVECFLAYFLKFADLLRVLCVTFIRSFDLGEIIIRCLINVFLNYSHEIMFGMEWWVWLREGVVLSRIFGNLKPKKQFWWQLGPFSLLVAMKQAA